MKRLNKFFVVVDGALGTAHTNREGRTVDFRPSEISLTVWGSEKMIRVRTNDGWTPDLSLGIERVEVVSAETSTDGRHVTMNQRFVAVFPATGTELAVCKKTTELTELGERLQREEWEAIRKEQQARDAELKRREPGDKAELTAWLHARLAEPLQGLTNRHVGRLCRKPGSWRRTLSAMDVVRAWLALHPVSEGNQFREKIGCFLGAARALSGSSERSGGGDFIANAVLDADEARRAERKPQRLNEAGEEEEVFCYWCNCKRPNDDLPCPSCSDRGR